VTGKSTLLLVVDVSPHARNMSRSITSYVDAIERAMLRRKISSSSMK
jgi:hypothetical protein